MKVIVDLHAIQGAQNVWEHSGTRDGFQEWGDSHISDTVAVIDFLAKRFCMFSLVALLFCLVFLILSKLKLNLGYFFSNMLLKGILDYFVEL